jgi:hypothetical protein
MTLEYLCLYLPLFWCPPASPVQCCDCPVSSSWALSFTTFINPNSHSSYNSTPYVRQDSDVTQIKRSNMITVSINWADDKFSRCCSFCTALITNSEAASGTPMPLPSEYLNNASKHGRLPTISDSSHVTLLSYSSCSDNVAVAGSRFRSGPSYRPSCL